MVIKEADSVRGCYTFFYFVMDYVHQLSVIKAHDITTSYRLIPKRNATNLWMSISLISAAFCTSSSNKHNENIFKSMVSLKVRFLLPQISSHGSPLVQMASVCVIRFKVITTRIKKY